MKHGKPIKVPNTFNKKPSMSPKPKGNNVQSGNIRPDKKMAMKGTKK